MEVAKAAGYQLPATAGDLNKVNNLDYPVLGIFGTGNLPVQWDKVPAAVPNGGKLPPPPSAGKTRTCPGTNPSSPR